MRYEVRVYSLTVWSPLIAVLEHQLGKRACPIATPTLIATWRYRWRWLANLRAVTIGMCPVLGCMLFADVVPIESVV